MHSRARAAARHLRRNTVAYLALFVALGGSAYAAGGLPKNSVGAKQLKRNSVTSRNVKDGSLLSADFAKGQLPQGERGARGEKGERGEPGREGARGETGYSIFDGPPPSGTTLTGYFFDQLPLASGKKRAFGVSFPVALAANQPAVVAFSPSVSGATPTDPECTGSSNEPTAPAGKVCIYSRGSSGSGSFERQEVTNLGYGITMTSTGGNDEFVSFRGVWAYTAP